MKPVDRYFTPEQVVLLKESATKLRLALNQSTDAVAEEILKGELGKMINIVLDSDTISPFEHIPYFEKMTRDFLPSVEEEYFEFYSLAKYGVPAIDS